MNAMVREVEQLLDTIDRLRAQHRAGIQPPFGELDDMFESAAACRAAVAAVATHGLTPPPVLDPAPRRATLERVSDGAEIRIPLSLGQAARALLEQLPVAEAAR